MIKSLFVKFISGSNIATISITGICEKNVLERKFKQASGARALAFVR
jgi:hypothetical protein